MAPRGHASPVRILPHLGVKPRAGFPPYGYPGTGTEEAALNNRQQYLASLAALWAWSIAGWASLPC
jgi:hypothetical protein